MDVYELWEKMSEFGDDAMGGVEYLSEHFEEIEEPDRSEVFLTLMKKLDEFPKEAQTKICFLSFRCKAGRERNAANLEKAARNLPPGKLRNELIGE